jgi:hypothetical protein
MVHEFLNNFYFENNSILNLKFNWICLLWKQVLTITYRNYILLLAFERNRHIKVFDIYGNNWTNICYDLEFKIVYHVFLSIIDNWGTIGSDAEN